MVFGLLSARGKIIVKQVYIYFNILEYLSTWTWFHLIKVIYKHFATQRYTAFLAPALLL